MTLVNFRWIVISLLSVFTVIAFPSRSYGATTVINFDDLRGVNDLTGSGYGGVIWQEGPVGIGGVPGYWASIFDLFNYPYSGLGSVANSGGVGLSIAFASRVNMSGAYAAAYGDNSISWTTGLRVHGFNSGQETAVTAWFTTISAKPVWFDMTSLSNVDRIEFELIPVYQGIGIFGLDDLTFTYIPEPTSLAILTLAGAGLLARRRGVS